MSKIEKLIMLGIYGGTFVVLSGGLLSAWLRLRCVKTNCYA